MNTLGQKIKMLRDREGMNVSDFAKAIGVPHAGTESSILIIPRLSVEWLCQSKRKWN